MTMSKPQYVAPLSILLLKACPHDIQTLLRRLVHFIILYHHSRFLILNGILSRLKEMPPGNSPSRWFATGTDAAVFGSLLNSPLTTYFKHPTRQTVAVSGRSRGWMDWSCDLSFGNLVDFWSSLLLEEDPTAACFGVILPAIGRARSTGGNIALASPRATRL